MKIHIVHGIRLCVFISLLALLPSPHSARQSSSDQELRLVPNALAIAQSMLPTADQIAATQDAVGRFDATDSEGKTVGHLVCTGDTAADSNGYRGPTEALLSLDGNDAILGVRVLRSHDTNEHVEAVRQDPKFLGQFNQMKLGGSDRQIQNMTVDGVSGATLTSLAMAEGILKKIGKTSSSLIFNRPLSIDDADHTFDSAASVIGDPIARVSDSSGKPVGFLMRTGPLVDDKIGYQGPTEILVSLDLNKRIQHAMIRMSYDNEPYVDYVRTERSFWKTFSRMSLEDLANWDPDAAKVEGVSGATMTSMSIAHALPEAARKLNQAGGIDASLQKDFPLAYLAEVIHWLAKFRWPAGELVTLAMLAALLVATQFHWMQHRSFRTFWLIAVVSVIGIWTGNLVSLALLTGWASSGVSWHLAIGLLCMAIVALALPPTTKSNPYCSHLCPHGALQQLIRPGSRSRRKWRLPAMLSRTLTFLPAMTLAVVYCVLLFKPSADVSVAEPFNAYSWRVASWFSIFFCMATLAFSAFVPMGYCRLGCPTGRLIDHVRLDGRSDQITRFDLGAALLLVLAIGIRLA